MSNKHALFQTSEHRIQNCNSVFTVKHVVISKTPLKNLIYVVNVGKAEESTTFVLFCSILAILYSKRMRLRAFIQVQLLRDQTSGVYYLFQKLSFVLYHYKSPTYYYNRIKKLALMCI